MSLLIAYAQYQQGKTAEEMGKAQQAWHQYNAEVLRQEKAVKEAAEREQTEFELKQHARQAKALLSRQRSLIGASGVNIEGSPLLVMEDTAAQLKLEEVGIIKQSQRRLQGLERFESMAILETGKGVMAKARGKAAKRAYTIAAGQTLLGGASQSASFMGPA